ncbi:MAG: hypothetical protein SFH39_00300 [Candidatus Magnetobacterium sp. LHC-1]
MKEYIKITIQEWAEDNFIDITEEQVNELSDAIDMCSEIELGTRGFTVGNQTKSDIETETLKAKLSTLEQFISSKGLNITYDVGYVTETFIVPISPTIEATERKTTYINTIK